MAKQKINVQGQPVRIFRTKLGEYICLTDLVKGQETEPSEYIQRWIRNASTIEFLGVWEKKYNSNFNPVEFDGFKIKLPDNRFVVTAKKWIEKTGAIGIQSKPGRYGGTYAHSFIAIHFANWLSPEFYLNLISEYEQLKAAQSKLQNWSARKILGNLNESINLLEDFHLDDE